MSAFIVEKESIERIASIISLRDTYKRRLRKDFNIDLEQKEGFNNLCVALYSLNYDSVNYRYRENTVLEPDTYSVMLSDNPFQDIKTIQCFLYQCSEGDIPDTKLFGFIEDLLHDLMYDVISKNPEYEKAKWI